MAAGRDGNGAIPLLELPVGRAARVAPPAGSATIPTRLEDLGFVPGTRLRVLRRAPFGDPIELEIRGYRLCLRAEQIVGLRVQLEPGDVPE
ncbi:MAG: FeoA domain-containing protein [Myxococcota bacterium]